MKIWLDDLRRPLPEFLWARSVGEAKALILECESRGEAPELISLDYELGGYELEARAKQILGGLGFPVADFDKPACEFSGGWQIRSAGASTRWRSIPRISTVRP